MSENLNISLKTAAKSIQVGICSFLLNLISEDQTEGHKSGTEKAINYFIDWSQPRFIYQVSLGDALFMRSGRFADVYSNKT